MSGVSVDHRTFRLFLRLAVLLLTAAPACSRGNTSPTVSISFPANIPFETVQIHYFMVGAFGGRGGQAESHRDLGVYEINASEQGQAATGIKILAYAAGCEIRTFDLSLSQNPYPHEHFVCKALPKVMLSGRVPGELIRERKAEIVIHYMAYWAHGFFGIADGPVTAFRLAIVSPDHDGSFRVEIPDFGNDSGLSSPQTRADLLLMLRESKTWNHIASSLKPELSAVRSEYGGLKIQSSYPGNLTFIADPTPD